MSDCNRLLPGDILEGFCAGYFGRDSFGDKRIEAVGPDWVVARETGCGEAVFAHDPSIHEFLRAHTAARP